MAIVVLVLLASVDDHRADDLNAIAKVFSALSWPLAVFGALYFLSPALSDLIRSFKDRPIEANAQAGRNKVGLKAGLPSGSVEIPIGGSANFVGAAAKPPKRPASERSFQS